MGLLCGISVFYSVGDSFFALMRIAGTRHVSIVSLLSVVILPFLLSAFVVYFSKFALLLPVCFFKAFVFSGISFIIVRAYGPAGWLFRYLFLFSDCMVMPILYWFWLRYVDGKHRFCGWEAAALVAIGLLIGSVDYRIISPMLARLIEF